MLRAVTYERVSTTRQGKQGYSLGSQRDLNIAFVQEQGWELVGSYSDQMSGTILDRPGLTEIRELVKQRKVDVVVVYEVDRLARTYVHQILIRDECKRAGVQLWYAKLKQKSGANAEEQIGENLLGILAEIEREKIADRMYRSRRKKATQNRLAAGGPAPYGYRYVGVGKKKTIEVDPEEAIVVQRIFRDFAAGHSAHALALALTAEGIPRPDASRYPNRKRARPAHIWDSSTIRKLLRKSTYAGKFATFSYTYGTALPLPADEAIYVDIPALVSADDWAVVQRRIDSNRHETPWLAKHPRSLLSGRITCVCGRTWTKAKHGYYGCWARKSDRGMRHTRPCVGFPYASDRRLAPMLWQWVVDCLFHEAQREAPTTDTSIKETARAEIAAIQARKDKLARMFRDGDIESDEYRRLRGELLAEQETLTRVLEQPEPAPGLATEDVLELARMGSTTEDTTVRIAVADALGVQLFADLRDGVYGVRFIAAAWDTAHWVPLKGTKT